MVDRFLRKHPAFPDHKASDQRVFLRQLAGKHPSPPALYIGCTDSRVLPEVLTGSSPGDLFVVHNVANLVPNVKNHDVSVGVAIEYAVSHLHVPHIIVCGHFGCGGVRSVIQGLEHLADCPSLVEWLKEVLPAVQRARETLGHKTTSDTLWRASVEENVLQQLNHLVSFPAIAAAMREDRIELHGWVYDPHTRDLAVYDSERGRFRLFNQVLDD